MNSPSSTATAVKQTTITVVISENGPPICRFIKTGDETVTPKEMTIARQALRRGYWEYKKKRA